MELRRQWCAGARDTRQRSTSAQCERQPVSRPGEFCMRGEKGREFSNFLMFLLSANEGRLAACSLELNLALVEEL